MATIKRGILGGMSGRTANVVGTSWKGREVIKSLPLSYADANSVAQQVCRSSMDFYVNLGKLVGTSFLRSGFNPESGKVSGYNVFISKNIKNGSVVSSSMRSKILFSCGSYVQPIFQFGAFIFYEAPNRIVYDSSFLQNGSEFSINDFVIIACFDIANGIYYFSSIVKNPLDSHDFLFDESLPIGTFDIYCGIIKENGLKVSNSSYYELSIV